MAKYRYTTEETIQALAALNRSYYPLQDMVATVVFWNRKDGLAIGRHRR